MRKINCDYCKQEITLEQSEEVSVIKFKVSEPAIDLHKKCAEKIIIEWNKNKGE